MFTRCFEQRFNHGGLAARPAAVRWRSLESQPAIVGLEEERGGGSGKTSAAKTVEPVDTAAPPSESLFLSVSKNSFRGESRVGSGSGGGVNLTMEDFLLAPSSDTSTMLLFAEATLFKTA